MKLRNLIGKRTYVRLIFTIILLRAYTNEANPDIDDEHMKKVPNCGQMSKAASSRLFNTEESKIHYPWIIRVVRYWRNDKKRYLKNEMKPIGQCGGTILTKRLDKFSY